MEATGSKTTTQDLRIPGPTGQLTLRLYRPSVASATLPVVLYFHGGGFVGGSLDDAERQATFLAEHATTLVVVIDYALAPTHPFPAAPEDAYATALWVTEHAAELGCDPMHMAVAGASASASCEASRSARLRREPVTLMRSRVWASSAGASCAMVVPMARTQAMPSGSAAINLLACARKTEQTAQKPRQDAASGAVA